MQGSALAREAMSSAAVTLYAAAVLPAVSPATTATDLAHGLFMPAAAANQSSPSQISGIFVVITASPASMHDLVQSMITVCYKIHQNSSDSSLSA